MDINFYPFILGNNLNRLFNVSYSPLAQNIKFFKTQGLCHVHIPLCCWKPLWGKIEGSVAINWLFGNQNAAGVNTPLVREICHHLCYCVDMTSEFTLVYFGCRVFCQRIDFRLWQAMYFAEFAVNRLAPKSYRSTQKCSVVTTITFKNIILHIIAILPRIVDIEIGWRCTLGIQESLKIQIQFNRINIGNF